MAGKQVKKVLSLEDIRKMKAKLKETLEAKKEASKKTDDEIPEGSVCASIEITFENGYKLVVDNKDPKHPLQADVVLKYLNKASTYAEAKGGAFLVGPAFRTIKPTIKKTT